jgi:hypothetical protein
VIPDNARTLRITAAAGTELAGAYSGGTLKPRQVEVIVPAQKEFTTLSAFVLHAAWLDQAPAHCPIFLTAASRRSWVRVSVPMWGAMLSHPLPIDGLVGRYPANYLIGRTPIQGRLNFNPRPMPAQNPMGYYRQFPNAFPRPRACCVRVTHPSAGDHRWPP